MNKKYIVVASLLASVTFVNAEGGATSSATGTMMRRQIGFSQKTFGNPLMNASSSPSEGKRMMMTTGDPVIDAKLKVLNEEMDAKIQAIRIEYQAKIKALIGDKKLLPMVVASGSPARMMQGEKGERNGQMMGSTTVRGFERADKQRDKIGSVKGATTDSPDNEGGMFQLKAFFQGLFGGSK
jgi:hypothetical protein